MGAHESHWECMGVSGQTILKVNSSRLAWALDVITHQARTVHVLLTRPISEVIRSCSDSHTAFISPRDQPVHHWCKILDQVGSVQVFYCIGVTKSGNFRFHAWRVLHSLSAFVIHKSKRIMQSYSCMLSNPVFERVRLFSFWFLSII